MLEIGRSAGIGFRGIDIWCPKLPRLGVLSAVLVAAIVMPVAVLQAVGPDQGVVATSENAANAQETLDAKPAAVSPAPFSDAERDRLFKAVVAHSEESTNTLIQLRDQPDPRAISVLESAFKYLNSVNCGLAAQALFSIGTPQALEVLEKHVVPGSGASHWSVEQTYAGKTMMQEPQRSRFIEQYFLQSLSKDLELQLEAKPGGDQDARKIELRVTVRNVSGKPFDLRDQNAFPGELYLRSKEGAYIQRTRISEADPGVFMWSPLGPGESRLYSLTLHVHLNLGSVHAGVYRFGIDRPGSYEVVALLDEKLQYGELANAWSGRVVSKPVNVEFRLPVVSPAKSASEAHWQGTVPPLPADDLDRLLKAALTHTEEGYNAMNQLRDQPDPRAIPVLETVLAGLPAGSFSRDVAAQALFCIGTPQALDILENQGIPALGHANRAVGVALGGKLKMKEPQCSQFIEQYLLKNLSKDLELQLEAKPPEESEPGRVELRLKVRNVADKVVRLGDRRDFHKELLLRFAGGRYLVGCMTADVHYSRDTWSELRPGQVREYPIKLRVYWTNNKSAIVLETGHFEFKVGKPGRFEALAMLDEAPPYPWTAARQKDSKIPAIWSGRAVSKPIQVEIGLPRDAGKPKEADQPQSPPSPDQPGG